MGNVNKLNLNIGKDDFDSKFPVVKENEKTCFDNCTLITINCDALIKAITLLDFSKKFISCPITYYKCENNIAIKNKLLSGYYSDQKLKDHTKVDKPDNGM